jgi:hypothetical protein
MSSLPNDPQPSKPCRQPSRRRPPTSSGRRRNWRSRCGTTAISGHRRATLARRLARAPHATTVWPFAEVAQLPGTTLLAGWLGRVIVTLVTRYSRPGDRILLVSPPAPTQPASPSPGHLRRPDCYVGLAEAVWTIIRLGRSAVATTTPPTVDKPRPPAVPTGPVRRDGSPPEVLPRPTQLDAGNVRDRRPDINGHPTHFDLGQAERFDLVVAAVSPHDVDWFARTDWNAVLAQTGILAAITHGDVWNGRFRDQLATIVGTLRSQGWSWLDHIAVLTQLLPDSAATPSPLSASTANHATVLDPESLAIRSVHHDVLLFSSMPPATPHPVDEARGTSDE